MLYKKLTKMLDNILWARKNKRIMRTIKEIEARRNKQSYIYTQEPATIIVGCECGNSKFTSKEPDRDFGQYYCVIECDECGYYWEGYMGFC